MDEADLRVGDTEREAALAALGEHLSAGRLDVDEYGERSARVTASKTRGDLLALFTDLPAPKPALGGPTSPAVHTRKAVGAPSGGEVTKRSKTPARRWADAAVPLSAIIATVLFFTVVNTWVIFMLIPAVAVLGDALTGKGKGRPRPHGGHGGGRGYHG